MTFKEYHAHMMKDPAYRFWHYVLAPRFFVENWLLRIRGWFKRQDTGDCDEWGNYG